MYYGIEIGKLVDEYELPKTALEFEKLRNNILNNPMYKGSIVSEDETASLIVFNILSFSIFKKNTLTPM